MRYRRRDTQRRPTVAKVKCDGSFTGTFTYAATGWCLTSRLYYRLCLSVSEWRLCLGIIVCSSRDCVWHRIGGAVVEDRGRVLQCKPSQKAVECRGLEERRDGDEVRSENSWRESWDQRSGREFSQKRSDMKENGCWMGKRRPEFQSEVGEVVVVMGTKDEGPRPVWPVGASG
ncbi:hypothetical protein VTJ04DRAFT_9296 [Mycothermus thermophilus]|uniref:uncharacterized protein n=1 Tax=Humicola insolens TaxID=85995 RepID=UPI003743E348